MTDQTIYDVAIVGASIAGCSAATFLARQGLHVALIERDPDPNAYKKVCTHFIQPSATPTIQRLGIARKIEEAGGIRNGAVIYTPWGTVRDTINEQAGRPVYGYSLRREVLDPMLRRLAVETPGVELILGQSARRLIREDGRISGVVTEGRDGHAYEVRARLVVGADGRHSRVAELAGVKAHLRPHNRFAYFAYFKNLPLATGTDSQGWFMNPAIAYAFPNDDGQTLVAVAPTKEQLPEFRKDIEGNCFRALEGLPDAPDYRHAERVSDWRGMIEMPNVSREVTALGLALIGDAAMESDPVWGVGCGWAFESAEWLAHAVGPALIEGSDLDAALVRYAKQHKRKLAGHHFLLADYATGRTFNPLERLMMSAAVTDAKTAHHFFKFGGRRIGVLQFMSPLAVGRAAVVKLRTGQRGRHARREGAAVGV